MASLHVPDLCTHRIIQILPTKAAIRMSFLSKQWEGVWCSSPVLDFDEGGDQETLDCRDDLGDQHRKFINILMRYLEFCGHDKQKKLKLDKLRLHMTGYLFREDTSIVDKLLSCSFERNVKELDISLRPSRLFQRDWHEKENYYGLSRTTFLDTKSITSLNLAYVRINDIRGDRDGPKDHVRQLLPSLKTMCLKTVHFHKHALRFLIWECPCIEYLSLTSCSFEDDPGDAFEDDQGDAFEDDQDDALSVFNISSSSLKFLEVKYCKARDIQVEETINLESFTFVSSKFLPARSVTLRNSQNLKHINIHARYLKNLDVFGSHHSLEATITTPNLYSVYFIGYLKSKIFLIAPKLWSATVLLRDFWDEQFPTAFDGGPWKHLSVLTGFLKEFDHCKSLKLVVDDFKKLIIPKEFRNTCSSTILSGLNDILVLTAPSYPKTRSDFSELVDSFIWFAPSVKDLFIEEIYGPLPVEI